MPYFDHRNGILKALLCVVLSVTVPLMTVAAVPNVIPFQGRLMMTKTDPLDNRTLQARFSFWSDPSYDKEQDFDSTTGALIGSTWEEVQTFTTDEEGFFILDVGLVNTLPMLDYNVYKYLQTEVKIDGGADTGYHLLDAAVDSPSIDRKNIYNSTFAQNSLRLNDREVGTDPGDIPYIGSDGYIDTSLVDTGTWLPPVATLTALNALTGVDEGSVAFVEAEGVLYSYQSGAWSLIGTGMEYNATDNTYNAGSSRLINLNAPVEGTDAATKNYVDDSIAALWYDPVADITARDALTGMGAGAMVFVESANALHIYDEGAWKQIGRDISYDELLGAFDLEDQRLVNVADPVNGSDAVNKGYLEGYVTGVINGLDDPDLWLSPVANQTDLSSIATPIEGSVVYVESDKALYVRNNGEWEQVGKDILYDVLESAYDLEGQRLMNAGAPTADGDVTNKAYVDTLVSNLELSVGALSDAWLDPVADLTALNALTGMADQSVAFVASEHALYVYKDSTWQRIGIDITHDQILNTFDFGSGRLINIADPVNGTDATNKTYVDSAISVAIAAIPDPELWLAPVANTTIRDALTGVEEGSMVFVIGENALSVYTQGAWQQIGKDIPFDELLGAYNVENNRLINLGGPVDGTDATNKTYVDSAISAAIAAIPDPELWLAPVLNTTARDALTGVEEGSMVFVITDNALSVYREGAWQQIGKDITFDALLGVFDLENQRITNSAAPVDGGDLANKDYVDTSISDAISAIPDPEYWLDPVANITARDALTGMEEGSMVFVISENALSIYTQGSWEQIGKDISYNDVADIFDLEGRRLTNAGTPTVGSDVTNKDYVDSAIAAIPDPELWLAPVANPTARDAITGMEEGSMVFVISDNALHLYTQGAWQQIGKDIPFDALLGTYNIEDQRLINVADAVDGGDAVNKSFMENYVSSVIAGLEDPDLWIPPVANTTEMNALTGVIEGAVVFVEDTSSLYVRNNGGWEQVATNIPYDPVTGTFDFFDTRLINVADPVNAGDATNKQYVDTSITNAVNALPDSYLWLDPVADITARDAITGMTDGSMVFVVSENAFHFYSGSAWTQVGVDILYNDIADKFDLEGRILSNAGTPVDGSDVTTKDYVDSAIAAIPDPDLWLTPVADVTARDAITGMVEGSMVFVVADNAMHLYTQGAWQKVGQDILYDSGNDVFNLQNKRITNSATPVDGGDLTNKTYVDQSISDAIAALPDPYLWIGPVTNVAARDALSGLEDGSMVYVESKNALHVYSEGAWTQVGNDIAYNDLIDGFDLEDRRLMNVANPVDGGDAVNKSYVESYVSSVISGLDDPDLWIAPVANLTELNALTGVIAGSIVYVEDKKAFYVRNNGAWEQVGKDILYDTVESAYDLEGQRLMNAAAPTADGDVTNKAYVDSADATLQASIDAIASAWLDPVTDLTELNALTGVVERAVAFVASENALYVYKDSAWQRIGIDITHDDVLNTFDFGAGRLVNIADPVNGNDAVNKGYMEGYVTSVINSLDDPDLWLSPVADTAAMNALTGVIEGAMVFVEDSSSLYVRNNGAWELAGSNIPYDPQEGTFDFGDDRIINVGTPTEDTDAATKGYVDEVFSSIHGNGVYLGVTTQLWTNGDAGGYVVADQACQAEYQYSHVCRTEEIFNTISTQDISTLFTYVDLTGAWILEGPPGFTAPANDCNGLTDGTSDYLGAFWQFNNTTGGAGALSICSQVKPFACCR